MTAGSRSSARAEAPILAQHLITHGLLFAVLVNGYLLVVMVLLSPRVWGYTDYPAAVKAKVPGQTSSEKRLAMWAGLPWFALVVLFPILSTYSLKAKLGGEIPFLTAFLNVFVLAALATLGDLVLLDWLLVSKITPRFVIIPGSEAADYKDFSHHYRAHARSAAGLIVLCLILAAVVWFF